MYYCGLVGGVADVFPWGVGSNFHHEYSGKCCIAGEIYILMWLRNARYLDWLTIVWEGGVEK